MGSPVQTVPPPRRHRSLFGPVVLIALGVVFLLGTMGILHLRMMGHWFARYWPLLIILWGIIKLMDYQQAKSQGMRSSGIGAGGVLLLIMLIVVGLAATQASRFNWGELRDEVPWDSGDTPWWGHTYNYDDQVQQTFPAGASLKVMDERGTVNINTSDDGQIRVTVHKRINAENQEDADKWNKGTRPQISASDHTVTLSANNQGAGDHWVAIDMEVFIPRKASVVISTRRGDVSLIGRDGDVEASNQHGDVSVSDVNGKVNLNLTGSSARISKVSSDVSVQGRPKDVSVEDVKGTVRLSGEFDSIKLARLASPVSFKSARTDLEFSKLNGDLDIDSGDMRASDIVGPLRLLTRSKDIRITGVSGDVRLQDQNGAVELRLTKLGSVEVSNSNSEIEIYLPDKAGFQLDARTHGGEIESDFNELKVNNEDDRGTASGAVSGGGPRIVLNNEHGTIAIRKGSSLAEAPVPPKPPHVPVPPKVPEPTEN